MLVFLPFFSTPSLPFSIPYGSLISSLELGYLQLFTQSGFKSSLGGKLGQKINHDKERKNIVCLGVAYYPSVFVASRASVKGFLVDS